MSVPFAGIAGIIWYVAWLWLSFEKPCKHPTISQEELIYIEESIGNVADNVITVSATFLANKMALQNYGPTLSLKGFY